MGQVKQKFLGSKGLIVLIALLSAFVPLSTDLYLPALPTMSDYFGTTTERINLTLTLFFLFYAVGTLIWGPLSDRHGRKPILLIGLGLYIGASVFCAFTQSVEGLIVCRSLQALGGSAAGAVAMAIVKDAYSGRQRESVLAIVSAMSTIAPAVAPVLGAFLLKVMSWRGVFWMLAAIGALALAGSLLFQETIEERTTGHVFESFGRMGNVLQNRKFTVLLTLFSLVNLSTMAYVSSSTYIYQDNFHLSSQAYSFYFSINAVAMIAAPMIFLWLSDRIKTEKIIWWSYCIAGISGLLLLTLGQLQPWIFLLCVLPNSFGLSMIWPASSNLMLNQQKGDTGAVSSLMNCTSLLVGSLGMTLISLPWGNMITALGVMVFSAAVISLLAWPFVFRYVNQDNEAEMAEA